MRSRNKRLQRSAVAIVALLLTGSAAAHPEDDFCVPGEDSLDPALCAALAELNRSDNSARQTELSPILDDSGNERSVWSTATLYVGIGVRHILPAGIDHILFVLAMFLASVRWRALLIQVSAFTVAHTVTLALAASGVITPSATIVEPLIALTIGLVAIENLLFRDMTKWRPALVFGFGLVHGMGFAGFFGELGLPAGQFWSALVGFNIGVEVGQLIIITIAAAIGFLLRRVLNDASGTRQYRKLVVLPGSAIIGLIGIGWFAERLMA